MIGTLSLISKIVISTVALAVLGGVPPSDAVIVKMTNASSSLSMLPSVTISPVFSFMTKKPVVT